MNISTRRSFLGKTAGALALATAPYTAFGQAAVDSDALTAKAARGS